MNFLVSVCVSRCTFCLSFIEISPMLSAALTASNHALALMLSPVQPEEALLDVRRASETPQRLASSRSALCSCSRSLAKKHSVASAALVALALPAPAARATCRHAHAKGVEERSPATQPGTRSKEARVEEEEGRVEESRTG